MTVSWTRGSAAETKHVQNKKKQAVYETCASKTNQLRLATQVVKMILKIDDVITTNDVVDEPSDKLSCQLLPETATLQQGAS